MEEPDEDEDAEVGDGSGEERSLEGRETLLRVLLRGTAESDGDGGAGDEAAEKSREPQAGNGAQALRKEVAGVTDG